MWIPGFGSEEIRPYKKACTTEAHKQVSDTEVFSIWQSFFFKGKVQFETSSDMSEDVICVGLCLVTPRNH